MIFKNKKQYSIASFDTLKINFIAIPKTGTSSFLTSLILENGNDISNLDHVVSHSPKYATYIDKTESIINNFYNISIIRNPYSRLLSQYKDFMYGYKMNHKLNSSNEFKIEYNKIKKDLDIYSFADFIYSYPNEERDVHFRDQNWFLSHLKDNKKKFYFTTENFNNGLSTINKMFNLRLKPFYRNTTQDIKSIDLKKTQLLENYLIDDFKLWMEVHESKKN